ncbi:MAG TPA: tRNA pseudouridine(55) synthase TruB [Firmicutes bacterium]|nr:tRNA pseudouridine(55) synthase TruB [Bacillota bacterium]
MVGLILLDKPEGMTSFGAAAALRRLTGEKRVGHTGTLDPMATGLLPILLGQATRLVSLLMETEKEYEAVLRLGMRTDTLDVTGRILETRPAAGRAELEAVLPRFTGEILQTPPMYSALKKDGVRLYELARQGKEVERKPRPVTIRELELLEACGPDTYRLRVVCSKGTYIRTLCDDIGRELGCGGVMAALRRTATGGFSIREAVTLEQLEADGPAAHLLPADRAVAGYPALQVSAAQAGRFLNGGQLDFARLSLQNPAHGALYRVYGPGNRFLGMGRADGDKEQLAVQCIIQI